MRRGEEPSEKAARGNENILGKAADLLTEGMAVFDLQGRFLAGNRVFRILRKQAEFSAFLASFLTERGFYAGETAREAAILPASVTFWGPEGVAVELNINPLDARRIVMTCSDISERRRLEREIGRHSVKLEEHVRRRTAQLIATNVELSASIAANRQTTLALRRSEARLREITDALPANVAYFDRSLTYRYHNRTYAQWFGLENGDLDGRRMEEVLPAEVYASTAAYLRRALAGERVVYEYEMSGGDGRKRYARSTLVPDIGSDGDTNGVYVHSVDITEQHHAQAALMHAQKMEAIGQLAGGLAHDFNNMLTVVIGNLLALRESGGGNPLACELIDPALQAADRCTELIRRLMTLSRQQPMTTQTANVHLLIQEVAQLFRRLLPETVAMTISCAEPAPLASVSVRQLEDALLNLVLNARDAMPEGGELQVDCDSVLLETAAAADLAVAPGRYVRISVRDSGVGMDEKTRMRVCEPFFTTKRGGSGLGMSMVHSFVQQCAGSLKIDSRPGGGTKISLYLPCADDVPVPVPLAVELAAVPLNLQGHLILLVEDDANVRKVVRKQLTSLGCLTLEAETADEAADLIENVDTISLVLSDVVMPGRMDGCALARFIRNFRPEVKVILMTAYTEHREQIATESVDYVLEKPFTPQTLQTALGRFLQAAKVKIKRETKEREGVPEAQ